MKEQKIRRLMEKRWQKRKGRKEIDPEVNTKVSERNESVYHIDLFRVVASRRV